MSSTRAVTPAGHSTDVWAGRIDKAPRLDLEELRARSEWAGRHVLLVVSAHPDDESLGCGRLMSAWARDGRVVAVTATAGEACVDHVMARPAGIGEHRMIEWRVALAALGAEPRSGPQLADGTLDQHETTLIVLLEELSSTEDPRGIVLAAPWRHDPHPDHAAVGRVAAEVAARRGIPLLEYPVWMTYWSDPDAADLGPAELLVVDCGDEAERAVERARSAFVSQLAPLRPDVGPVLPAAMLEHHRQQLVIISGRR